MNLFIEGLDNTGKDTLIKYIVKNKLFLNTKNNVPFNILHCIGTIHCKKKEMKTQFENMFKILFCGNEKNIILNRSHLGEYVYGPIYRKYDSEYIFDLEKKYKEVLDTSLLILLYSSDFSILDKREDGKSIAVDNKEIELVKFKEAYNKSNINYKLLFDVSKIDTPEMFESIKELIIKNKL